MRINSLLVAIVALVGMSAGCKKKDPAAEALAKLGEFKTKMCACKDGKCAKGVDEEMEKYMTEMEKKNEKQKDPPADMVAKLTTAMTDISTCKTTAEQADAAAAMAASMTAMTAIKDKMCACTDAACAQKVSDEMTAGGNEQAKNAASMTAAPNPDDMKKMTDISTALGECMTKAMTAGAGVPPATGSAEGSAAPAAGSDAGSAAPAAAGSDTGSAAAPADGSGSAN